MTFTGPTHKKRHKDLTIVHASLQVFDTDWQAVTDLHKILDRTRPHLIGGTEGGDLARKALLHEILESKGYIAYTPEGGDSWLGVKQGLAFGEVSLASKKVIPSAPALGDPHHFSSKHVTRASFNTRTLGPITFIGGLHDLTMARRPGQAQQDKPGDPVNHVEMSKKYMAEAAEQAKAGARGDGISFLTGDFNRIDRTSNLMYDEDFLSCWDELQHWPDTGHGNIDAVIRLKSDRRVDLKDAYVLTDRDLALETDHFLTVTKYRVQKLAGPLN